MIFLNMAFDHWPEAVASSLQHTASGTVFLMRNVTVPLDQACVDIPPLKSLKVSSQGLRRHIRFYDHIDHWTSSLGWLREFLDKVTNLKGPHVRAVFGLSEGALVRFENVTVDACTTSMKAKKSILYLGCTWAGHHQSGVEIQDDHLSPGVAGATLLVMLGDVEVDSCECGECEPQWFTAGWICPVVLHRRAHVRRFARHRRTSYRIEDGEVID